MDRATRQVRSAASKFETREEDNELKIEGYFAVFNSIYQIFDDLSESVAPGAFDDTLGDDIRALINHDSSLVLGRNTAHTLDLRQDEHGLWGSITINPNDQDAMNLYARVQRGDVDQCSFGFDILSEDYDVREDGSVHWTIKKVRLYEVSVCTFPAYEETNVKARSAQRDEIKKRSLEAWKVQTLAKLKGEK
jgi:HK97 family phage prohead protease